MGLGNHILQQLCEQVSTDGKAIQLECLGIPTDPAGLQAFLLAALAMPFRFGNFHLPGSRLAHKSGCCSFSLNTDKVHAPA